MSLFLLHIDIFKQKRYNKYMMNRIREYVEPVSYAASVVLGCAALSAYDLKEQQEAVGQLQMPIYFTAASLLLMVAVNKSSQRRDEKKANQDDTRLEHVKFELLDEE